MLKMKVSKDILKKSRAIFISVILSSLLTIFFLYFFVNLHEFSYIQRVGILNFMKLETIEISEKTQYYYKDKYKDLEQTTFEEIERTYIYK